MARQVRQSAQPQSRTGARRRRRSSMRAARWRRCCRRVGRSSSPPARPKRSTWRMPVARGGIVTFATEHAAVLDTAEWLRERGRDLDVLPGRDRTAVVDLDQSSQAALQKPTALVAAMLVNNEIGVVQPIAEIAALAHEAGALMLCDAVQGFGRLPIPDGPDLIAVSAHKIHGPKGIGALWVRDGVSVDAADPRRRAGAGAALGHAVADAVRRVRRGGGAGGGAERGRSRACREAVERSARHARARTGPSTAAPSIAIAATSTSAAKASTPPACSPTAARSPFPWDPPAPADRAARAMCFARSASATARLGKASASASAATRPLMKSPRHAP